MISPLMSDCNTIQFSTMCMLLMNLYQNTKTVFCSQVSETDAFHYLNFFPGPCQKVGPFIIEADP